MSTANDGKVFAVKDDVLRVMDLNIEAEMIAANEPTYSKTVNESSVNVNIGIPDYTQPVATYIHDSNPEIYVSAVDVDTNTFTSVGHGLSNGDTIYPILNQDAGNVYPLAVYAGGLTQTALGYYVINATADTFQLSATSGGASIDITTNATTDLTKWHFEKATVNTGFTVDNLPAMKKYKIVIQGRCLQFDANASLLVNDMSWLQDWINTWSEYGTYYYSKTGLAGDVLNYAELIVDASNILTIKEQGFNIRQYSNTQNRHFTNNRLISNLNYTSVDITSLKFNAFTPANGYKVEVYNA